MSTIIDLSATATALRDVIEAWAADGEPPRVRGDAGYIVSLRKWLSEGDAVPGIPAQLDSTSAALLHEIVPPDDLEDFDGTEQDAALLLLIELVRNRGNEGDAQGLQMLRADMRRGRGEGQ